MNQYHNTIEGIKSFSFVPSIMSATIKIRWAEDEHVLVLESDIAQILIKKEYARHPTEEEVEMYHNSVDKEAEEKAAADKKAAEEKAAADKLAADKLAADKLAADKKAADEKAAADKLAADKLAADKKAAEEKAAADKK